MEFSPKTNSLNLIVDEEELMVVSCCVDGQDQDAPAIEDRKSLLTLMPIWWIYHVRPSKQADSATGGPVHL